MEVEQPKSVRRAKQWDIEVEEAYRFQIAGYRDALEYSQIHPSITVHINCSLFY
jgi:hypothetical protein